MGTKTAPSYANIVVAIFELLYVYTYKLQPLVWERFIDDIFGIWTHGIDEFTKFVEFLNTCVDGLKFTVEHSFEKISFLDTQVFIQPDRSLSTSLYRKPTDTYNYIRFNSAHPASCKMGIPYGQFLRIRRICTKLADFDHHSNEMAKAFKMRGYPSKLVDQALIKAREQSRDTLLEVKPPKEKSAEKQCFLIQTYHPDHNPLQEIVSENWKFVTKNPNLKMLNDIKLTIANRRPKNLRDLLTNSTFLDHAPKRRRINRCWNPIACRYCPKLEKTGRITSTSSGRTYTTKQNITCQSSNLIYCIQCKKCKVQYVGQTSRRLMDRFQGHFSSITNKRAKIKTLIHDHFNQIDHHGTADMSIYILDFIHMTPKSDRAKKLRLKIEQNWIHRLKSVHPQGLNLDT